jgi:hypothetical protein
MIFLYLLLVDFDRTSPIKEILLILQQQCIEILLLFDQFLLSRGRFKLMRADLQRHLLSAWILLLG